MKNLKLTVTEREEIAPTVAGDEPHTVALSCTDIAGMSAAVKLSETPAQPGPLSPLEP